MIRTSRSGLELSERGFAADLDIALEIDSSRTAPRLVDGQYSNDAHPENLVVKAP
jgi:phosphosulfolactate phosphohydrolase-like enzyme